MKREVNEIELVTDYNNGFSLPKICEKYKIGKIRAKEIIVNNNGRIRDCHEKRIHHNFVVSDYHIKKYENTDEYFFIAKYKDDESIQFLDCENKGGHLTDYIRKTLGIEIPSLYDRRIYYQTTGNYWWEQWFNVEKHSKNNEKKIAFIKKAKLIHKNENIDYSQVEYKNNRTPVLLIDRDLRPDGTEYGEYWQTPSNHLKGQSHPDKRKIKISLSKRHEQIDIIKRFKEIHKNENLDYSQVEYVNMHTKVKIIDRDLKEDGTEYGEYWQEPVVHLKGCGHPLKGILKNSKSHTSTTEEFIKKSKIIHNTINYNYDKIDYINNRTKVEIICPIHGSFFISPDNFLQGKGCQKCGSILSKSENEISNIISKYYKVEHNNRNILDGLEIDIYVPELKIGIEYNGLRWHSDQFKEDKNYHLNKLLKANEKGVKLIQIFEDEYLNNKDIVLNKLFHLLKIDLNKTKIGARKCNIREISNDLAKIFLNKNHIQGYTSSTIHFGAFLDSLLVAVMSFTKIKNEWVLTRFASDYNYVCQGIGSKLFKHFIKQYTPQTVKSFADRRWTIDMENNLYIKLGFNIENILGPEYRYYNPKLFGNERKHKFGFRKQILSKKYGLPLTMTESEMAKELGCSKIWDCGLIKYVWRNSNN